MILIAGPCVIESEEHTLRMAHTVTEIADKHGLDFYFKASWDKANRTSIKSYRGVTLFEGMRILDKVKERVGCKVTSDIHESWQAEEVKDVLDLIQIPALLSRQTDLILAAAKTGKPVNIKKGQFMTPESMRAVMAKAICVNCAEIMVTERGNSFGYNNVVVDMRSLEIMKLINPDPPKVIFDASHPAGERGFVAPLARAAAAVGIDGLFVECHDDPDKALCDGGTMITPQELDELVTTLC